MQVTVRRSFESLIQVTVADNSSYQSRNTSLKWYTVYLTENLQHIDNSLMKNYFVASDEHLRSAMSH